MSAPAVATLAFARERFRFVLEDLEAASGERAIVAEGFQLLPELVQPVLQSPRQAVWLVSTDRFRLEALHQRRTVWEMPHQTRNPARALQHRLDRDEAIAAVVREQAERCGLRVIDVDVKRPLAVIASEVEAHAFPLMASE